MGRELTIAATGTHHDAIIRDLTRVYAALQHLSLPTWLKLDVSMAQLKTLVVVDRAADGLSVTAIGRDLEIGEPSASLLVEQLVKRGYAERATDPDDRRRVVVTATDLGRELLGELRHGRRQHVEEWLESVSADDAEALARGLRALAEAMTRESTR
jgi:DNA-binding MarR family transcriptional regulator